VKEVDEVVGYDLSGFDGLPMKNFEPQTKLVSAADARERERDLNEAGHVAEFERLEAQLGSGMTSILQKPFTHTPAQPLQGTDTSHRRQLSSSEIANVQAKDAQTEAEKTGGIVAVAEVPIDISDFAADIDFDRRSSSATAATSLARDEAQKSYFFPPGKLFKRSNGIVLTLQILICRRGDRSLWAGPGSSGLWLLHLS
jgi:hypothetical protein